MTHRAGLEAQYLLKELSYYGNAREDYVAALPLNPRAAILDVGCGDGATGALALREGKCGTYVGVELFEPVAVQAKRVLTEVHVGSIETMELPYPPGSFDAVICSEVLEHLLDPEAVVRRLALLLKPGGRIYASSPNISHWRLIASLLSGRFDYEESGALDRTHLRWFTPRSFQAMFDQVGIKVDRLQPVGGTAGFKGFMIRLLGSRFGHLLWYRIDLHGHRVA